MTGSLYVSSRIDCMIGAMEISRERAGRSRKRKVGHQGLIHHIALPSATHKVSALWCSGCIRASDARGPGFKPPKSPRRRTSFCCDADFWAPRRYIFFCNSSSRCVRPVSARCAPFFVPPSRTLASRDRHPPHHTGTVACDTILDLQLLSFPGGDGTSSSQDVSTVVWKDSIHCALFIYTPFCLYHIHVQGIRRSSSRRESFGSPDECQRRQDKDQRHAIASYARAEWGGGSVSS